MAVPEFTMRQLLEAGVHFGHQTHRWNPKMQSYIYGSRNGIHIIDLAQTVPLLHQALLAVTAAVAKGGRVLFVGTKRTAQEQIADSAKRSAQFPLAGWHAHQLEDHFQFHQASPHPRRATREGRHGPHQARNAVYFPRENKAR